MAQKFVVVGGWCVLTMISMSYLNPSCIQLELAMFWKQKKQELLAIEDF